MHVLLRYPPQKLPLLGGNLDHALLGLKPLCEEAGLVECLVDVAVFEEEGEELLHEEYGVGLGVEGIRVDEDDVLRLLLEYLQVLVRKASLENQQLNLSVVGHHLVQPIRRHLAQLAVAPLAPKVVHVLPRPPRRVRLLRLPRRVRLLRPPILALLLAEGLRSLLFRELLLYHLRVLHSRFDFQLIGKITSFYRPCVLNPDARVLRAGLFLAFNWGKRNKVHLFRLLNGLTAIPFAYHK